jgi:predicted GIY-YIG superfamily endonuclease
VSRYLEHVPRSALAQRHARPYIAGFRGLYVLFKERKLRYVGLATDDLERRLLDHMQDRLSNAWDSFSAYCLTDAAAPYLHDLEAAFHRVSAPKKNRQKGRFVDAEDVSIAVLRSHGAGSLHPFLKSGRLEVGATLRMQWRRSSYVATVSADGHILYDGKLYTSPSAAGKSVTRGIDVDGWVHWRYEASRGVWHQLTRLRTKISKRSKRGRRALR